MLSMRLPLALVTAAAAMTAILLPAAAPAATDTTPTAQTAACPGTFQVLHDDRIGTLKLPAGPYTITPTGLTCGQASSLFTRFLQDWDGILPGGWKVKGSGFQRGTSTVGFTVKPSVTPPTPPPPNGQTCPGHFTLRANDRIGALSLSAGNYVVQLTKKGGSLNCDQADREFALFLTKYYSTPLPSPWTLNAKTATFSRGKGIGFKVVKDGGGTGGGGSTTGILCPGTFQVLHDDRIGALKVPAGKYLIYVIGKLTCPEVTNDFKLDLQMGRIPSKNWTLDVQTATFLFLKTRGFRVEPANGV